MRAYRLIRERLPRADLFYYASLDQQPESIVAVIDTLAAAGLKLRWVGYSLYPHYEYLNGAIKIPDIIRAQLLALKRAAEARDVEFFVGEVGFRNCDPEGWAAPYDYKRTYRPTDCRATISYLLQAIGQAAVFADTIGVWNLDGSRGDPFGLWNNPHRNLLPAGSKTVTKTVTKTATAVRTATVTKTATAIQTVTKTATVVETDVRTVVKTVTETAEVRAVTKIVETVSKTETVAMPAGGGFFFALAVLIAVILLALVLRKRG